MLGLPQQWHGRPALPQQRPRIPGHEPAQVINVEKPIETLMKKTVITFGLVAGAITVVYSYISVVAFIGSEVTWQDMERAELFGYIRYLLLLVGVVMAMVTYRKNTGGTITYGRIFMVGMLVSLVIALFVGAMEYAYLAFINPDFYGQYGKAMIEGLQQAGASAAELEEARQQQQDYAWLTTPVMTGIFYFVQTAVIGIIFALMAAFFLRRNNETVPPEGAGPLLNQSA